MHMPFIQPYAVSPDMVLPKCSDAGEPIKDMDKHRPVPSVSYGTGWLGSVSAAGLLQSCIEEDNAQLLFSPMVYQEKIGVRELLSLFRPHDFVLLSSAMFPRWGSTVCVTYYNNLYSIEDGLITILKFKNLHLRIGLGVWMWFWVAGSA